MKRVAICGLMLVVVTSIFGFKSARGQNQTGSLINLPDLFNVGPRGQQEGSRLSEKAVPMDSPLKPSEYYVGPNDVLMLNVWSSAPVQHEMTVTPEGSLLIPTVGEVSINGLTLEEVKQKVAGLARKKYPGSEISVSLIAPRSVAVKIFGQVLNEGPTVASSLSRVHQLIADANALKAGQTIKDYFESVLPSLQSDASQRHIVLRHQDGSLQRVDLVKYEITGDGEYDPYLREGDVVFVPRRSKVALGIFGGGGRQAEFEFVPGDSITDLIAMGLAFSPRADSTAGFLSRLSLNGTRMDTISVNPASLRDRTTPNIAMQPGDRLVIRQAPEVRRNFFVSVEGAVKQAAFYPIAYGTTKLSEVIRMAGGFSMDAYIPGATLVRSRASPLEARKDVGREILLSQRANLAIEDTAYYHVETELRISEELVSVDFARLFVEGDSTQDVILHPYDKIVVPTRSHSVYVFGQVISPGHVPYVKDKGYAYYIGRAGGFASDARGGDLKIIKGNTREWLDPSETEIEDGDYIWIPREIHKPFSYYVTTYAQIASILAAVATVALLIRTY